MNLSECVKLGLTIFEQDVILTSHPHILVVSAVFLVLMTSYAFLSNVTVMKALILSIINDRKRVNSRHNEITKHLMSSMAISDALLAVLVMPLGITEVINNGKWVLGFRTCIVKYCLDYLLSGVPCFHVFCMALDRYIAVCHPLRYRLLSHKHAYVMICLSWMIPCLFLMSWIVIGVHEFDDCMKLTNACSLFNFKTEFIIAFVFTYVVPFFVMYFLYLLIIRKLGKIKKPLGLRMKCRISKQADTQLCFESVVSRQIESPARNISTVQVGISMKIRNRSTREDISCISSIAVYPNSVGDVTTSDFTDSTKSAINRNTKAFRTIGLVMICFTICWLPSWIWLFVFLVRRSPTPSWFTVCVSWFAYLNSTLNPVLYCCNRSVRMAVRSVMCPSSVTK